MDALNEKYSKLKNYFKELGSVAVAFSGGVDSTFLLKTAHDVLKNNAIAVTASSNLFPKRELKESSAFCKSENICQVIFNFDEFEVEGFRENPPNRCYLCKHKIFSKIKEIAAKKNITYVVEGSNMDDNEDYRPGLRAIAELDIKSPLRYAELYKNEIRTLSKEMNLPTWDKPSFACLASRFVYGEIISEERLAMVERAEQFLMDAGFKQFRVRIHDKIARIEIMPEDFDKIMKSNIRTDIINKFKNYGFQYVTLDLQGYRTGSMNETIEYKIC